MLIIACITPKPKQETAFPDEVEVIECGYDIGEYACNISSFDQNNNEIDLWDYKGKTILLDFSTMWCYYCNVAAMDENTLLEEYKDHDLVWITVLIQDKNGDKPSHSDLKAWSSQFNLKDPVLSGDVSMLDFEDDEINTGYKCGGYPTFVLIDKDMIINQYLFGWSSTMIREILDSHFNTREIE
tara:strand:- start:733 stop:1284 length:552 start_codon:yes stop_codon:yes gene_type:complete